MRRKKQVKENGYGFSNLRTKMHLKPLLNHLWLLEWVAVTSGQERAPSRVSAMWGWFPHGCFHTRSTLLYAL